MSLLMTTTDTLEGKRVVRYLGLVTGEASAEVKLVSDKAIASFADAYHQAVPSVRDNAIRGAIQGAQQVGANAVIGTRIDYVVHGSGKGMVMVTVTGTAVVMVDI